MFLLYTGRRLEKNTRKPQDTTKTFKFDTTRNLLYWENKLEGISDDGAEHTNAEHGCGRRVFPAALHIGRGGLTLTKKKIATDTHDAPKLLNRRLDLRVECATSENAPPRESHRHATSILCFNVCEALGLRPVHSIFPHSIFLVYIGTRLEKKYQKAAGYN